MMREHIVRTFPKLTSGLLLWLLAAAAASQPQQGGDYSKEQMLLFGTHHLENVTSEGVLHYRFQQTGSATRELDDKVTLAVTKINDDGSKDLSTEFLSGDDRKAFNDVPGFNSNPLVMYFLQWDVEKMDGGTGVPHHYYRHLLRQAMRTGVRSEEVTVTHGGRKLKGDKVSFEPLAGKRGDEKYGSYPSKRYEFILTEAVPGYIYSISTTVPGEKPDDKPLELTRLTFDRVEPAAKR